MAPIIRINKVVSTKLKAELRKRAASFRGARIAARIQVPSDLSWWYYLEFGTATRTLSDAPYGVRGSAYRIEPIDRGDSSSAKVLHWGPEGGGTFVGVVKAHPGIRPHPFVRQALPDIMKQFAADIAVAVKAGGFRADVLRQTLMEQTMVFALAKLVDSLSVAAPGTREDGNLQGNTAAEVFEEEAEIVSADDFSPGDSWTKPRPPRVRYVVTNGKVVERPPVKHRT